MGDNERLASVEAKLQFLKELMLEVRDDLKGTPTKEEYDKLEQRINELEKSRFRDGIKIGVASGLLGILFSLVFKFFT